MSELRRLKQGGKYITTPLRCALLSLGKGKTFAKVLLSRIPTLIANVREFSDFKDGNDLWESLVDFNPEIIIIADYMALNMLIDKSFQRKREFYPKAVYILNCNIETEVRKFVTDIFGVEPYLQYLMPQM